MSDLEHGPRVPVPWQGRRSVGVDIAGTHAGRRVAVEYDGDYWHHAKSRIDRSKTCALLDAGYLVIRIREVPLPHLDLEDPRLLQCGHRWGEPLADAVGVIERWLNSGKHLPADLS